MTENSFQTRAADWTRRCFGDAIANDKTERNHRFLEESLELLQANDCSRDDILRAVDYVFSRDKGEAYQEAGGVMVTLAALCAEAGLDMHTAGETELADIEQKTDAIREKHANKPNFGMIDAIE